MLNKNSGNDKIIRLLLVEDSPVALAVLKRMLSSATDIEVVGTAHNGKEALRLIPEVNPHVICTDIHMPKMNGVDFTREVMSRFPLPILVISVSVHNDDSKNIFDVLKAGAIDVFPKPRAGLKSDSSHLTDELIKKIRILSGVMPIRKHKKKPAASVSNREKTAEKSVKSVSSFICQETPSIIAVGASTGGPQTIHTILKDLPLNYKIPLICVQHISEGFLQGLIDWLSLQCKLKVVIASEGEKPMPGKVYFPPERLHLKVDDRGRFRMSSEPAFDGHRPSISVTFKSLARYYGASSMGILLSGMGKDGADGLKDIFLAKGITIAQDEETSIVFGMPKQAIETGAAGCVLSTSAIAEALLELNFSGCKRKRVL